MRYSVLCFFFFASQIKCFCQASSNLDSKFHTADSIVLIKHLATNNPVIIDDLTGKSSPQTKLLIGKKLNNAIVLKRVNLSEIQANSLLNILNSKYHEAPRHNIQCFIPRHSILIYKKGKISYIKLCFECLDFETSGDIILEETSFGLLKWRKLQEFFSELKLFIPNEDYVK